ncbi:exosortase A [Candidatus Nitrosacidococcus tergens]|uniref:Exosortase 1 n=1 Tax=Candidatus Nitrosacidococcus tergens TaxID=553981 RepID=A0A7G1QB51_9GAMM|nr:exosortase A [Candidatus Nitrosacidococcus tergens]CAB1276775.1 Exosortase 1 [Candidatus Nitrosacidococcus tergens]
MNTIKEEYKYQVHTSWGSRWVFAASTVSFILIALLLIYRDTLTSIIAIWLRSETFTHGILIFPISGYMIWTRRKELQQIQPKPQPVAIVLICLIAIGWLLAHIAAVQFAQQLLFIALLIGITWGILGSRVVRALTFPLAYLFFAVPIGEALIPPLQDFTAYVSVKGLQMTGVPVYLEGLYITIPSGTFEVAEACSGLRYLISSLALGTLYAYLSYQSYYKRAIFIAFSIIVPIIANGIRAYMIIMIAYLSSMKLATGIDHIIYGWIFFGAVIFFLFWAGSFWRESNIVNSISVDSLINSNTSNSKKQFILTGLLLITAASLGPISAIQLYKQPINTACTVSIPKGSLNWSGPFHPSDVWDPSFPSTEQDTRQVYSLNNEKNKEIQILTIYYPEETQDSELINSQNHLYDGKVWQRVSEENQLVALEGKNFQVRELVMRSTNGYRLVWYWYNISGWQTINLIKAKIFEAWGKLIHPQTHGSILIAVATDIINTVEVEKSKRLLSKFLNENPATTSPRSILACK